MRVKQSSSAWARTCRESELCARKRTAEPADRRASAKRFLEPATGGEMRAWGGESRVLTSQLGGRGGPAAANQYP